MVDNTQVNSGSGDNIRDIDRGTAKTQVVQLDAGGQAAESLVSASNPLPVKIGTTDANAGGLPVIDPVLVAAQTTDAPLSVSLAGDPNGDFAGINILEKLVDDSGDLKMAVRVVNPPGKFDAQGAEMLSDAPAPILLNGATGQFLYIDTTGYQSIEITSPTSGGMTVNPVAASNDLVTWSTVLGYSLSAASSAPAASLVGGNSAIFPTVGRYLRLNLTLGGTAVAYLRNIPAPNPAVIMPQNIAQIGGSSVLSPGVAGGFAVGGMSPSGGFVGATNPVAIGSIDSGTPGITPTGGGVKGGAAFRPLLLDSSGRLRIAEESPLNNPQNVAAIAIHDVGQFEGQDKLELLAQILNELKVVSHLLFELPNLLNAGLRSTDEPATLRSDPTIFTQ